MKIDAITVQDDGKSENAHSFTAEELAIKKGVYIDLFNDSIHPRKYNAKSDPGKVYIEFNKIS